MMSIEGTSATAVRTFFIFLDLPVHVELKVDGLPLLSESTVVDFNLNLNHHNKSYHIAGEYRLRRRILKFGGKHDGLTQYLEWERA